MQALKWLAILMFSVYSNSAVAAELTPEDIQYQEFRRIMDIEAGEIREIEKIDKQQRMRSEKLTQLAVLCGGLLGSNSCLQKLALHPELERFKYFGNFSLRDLVEQLIRSQNAQD